MKKISDFLYSLASLKTVILTTALMVLYAWLVLGRTSHCFQIENRPGSEALGLEIGYSHDYVLSLFSLLDTNALQCYKTFLLIWDNIFALIYGIMYLIWVSFLMKKIGVKQFHLKLLNVYPIILTTMDWSENYFEIKLVNSYLNTSSVGINEVRFASAFNIIKWCFSYTNYLILLLLLVLAIIEYRKNKTIRKVQI